jgi:hypothetical protein
MRRALVLGLALPLLTPLASAADEIELGARIRLVAPAPRPVYGERVRDADSASETKTESFMSEADITPRTYTRPGQEVRGTLLDVTDDAIVLEIARGQRTIRVPRDAVVELEVSVARSRKKRGAALGALTGLGVAVVFAAIAHDPDLIWGDFGTVFAGSALLFVPSGLAVGAIVAPGEQWRSVMPDSSGKAHIAPRRFGFSFAIRF